MKRRAYMVHPAEPDESCSIVVVFINYKLTI